MVYHSFYFRIGNIFPTSLLLSLSWKEFIISGCHVDINQLKTIQSKNSNHLFTLMVRKNHISKRSRDACNYTWDFSTEGWGLDNPKALRRAPDLSRGSGDEHRVLSCSAHPPASGQRIQGFLHHIGVALAWFRMCCWRRKRGDRRRPASCWKVWDR